MHEIGYKAQFSFDFRDFVLTEIIESPNLNMWWTWKHEICPHCKEIIEKRTLHNFLKIEIYIPIGLDSMGSTFKDLVVLGYASDGKILTLTRDKIDKVLERSEKFKHLLGGSNGNQLSNIT